MGALTTIPEREDIVALHRAMLPIATEMPPPLHFWLPGLYLRVLTLPAGCTVVGKIHRHDHYLAVLKGHAEVVDGFSRFDVEAGYSGVSPAGAKRAIHCYEETTFLTVHKNPSNTRDLSAIEAEHIAPDDATTVALAARYQQGAIHDLGSCRSSRRLTGDESGRGFPSQEATAEGADEPADR